MTNTGFEASRWDHWLLIVCFISVASYGLWISWQWREDQRKKQLHQRMAYRLRVEVLRNGLSTTHREGLSAEHREALSTKDRKRQGSPFSRRNEDRQDAM